MAVFMTRGYKHDPFHRHVARSLANYFSPQTRAELQQAIEETPGYDGADLYELLENNTVTAWGAKSDKRQDKELFEEMSESLRSAVTSFYDAVDADEIEKDKANEVITELSRRLTRLYLVEKGRFSQDPATSRNPVPRYAPAKKFTILDGDDRRFLQVQLKREQNEVVQQLKEARDILPSVR